MYVRTWASNCFSLVSIAQMKSCSLDILRNWRTYGSNPVRTYTHIYIQIHQITFSQICVIVVIQMHHFLFFKFLHVSWPLIAIYSTLQTTAFIMFCSVLFYYVKYDSLNLSKNQLNSTKLLQYQIKLNSIIST